MPYPIPVPGPERSPGRHGLLNAITTPAGVDVNRFGPGTSIVTDQDQCLALSPLAMPCTAPQDLPEHALTQTPPQPWRPFLVFGFDACSTMSGRTDDDIAAAARRNLIATASHQAEREFFDGAATEGTGAENPYLAGGDIVATLVTAAATAPGTALALLDGELTECLHGNRGMIHAHPTVVSLFFQYGGLQVAGTQLLTPNDHIVVSGSGYSGDQPNGTAAAAGSSYAYGTPLVYGVRGEVDVPGGVVEHTDIEHNTTEARARQVIALWMAQCCRLAAQVSLA